jgi:branched-chain amino acid transport system permease protein
MNRTLRTLAIGVAVLVLLAPFMPQWALFLLTVAFGKGLVVLGLLLLMRAGLVPFGQGLYYCLGGYAAGLAGKAWQISDAFALLALGLLVAVLVAFILGMLLCRYRDIFFAMLSLAFSMILYGILVKSQALGSTDGFNVAPPTFAGLALTPEQGRLAAFVLAALVVLGTAALLDAYLATPLGRLAAAIRDNEIRVEYMGASVQRVLLIKQVVAAALAGLGGALTAITVGHIDPEMSYWTTSGEFVFVTVMSGTGNVLAPMIGSVLFEALRSLATERAPNVWQMIPGTALLAIIMFLPRGLWSVLERRRVLR